MRNHWSKNTWGIMAGPQCFRTRNSAFHIPHSALDACKIAATVWALALLSLTAGCDLGGAAYRQVAAENLQLKDKAQKLEDQNKALTQQRDDLQARVDTLMNVGGQRLAAIPQVTKVEIGQWTAGYSAARGKGHDSVKVYLIPVDASGTALKAPGSLTIRLFDLAAPQGQELVGQCQLTPAELDKQWFSGAFMAYHYSVVCPFTRIPQHKDVTVRIEFVDYVTGKTFSAVTTIAVEKPDKLAPTSKPAAS